MTLNSYYSAAHEILSLKEQENDDQSEVVLGSSIYKNLTDEEIDR